MPGNALLDTDILSALMRQHTQVLSRAKEYLSERDRLAISIITQYEILRGLNARGATSQLSKFGKFCESLEIIELSTPIVIRAADIYADLHRRGKIIGDADILIAATAIENNLTLVSNNQTHFLRITGLELDNWNS